MSDNNTWRDGDIERYVTEMSKVLGLTIEPEYKPNIIMFLRLAAEMAETLDHADIAPTDAEFAPVFRLPYERAND